MGLKDPRRGPNEVNANRLDMKLQAQRKNLGRENLEKVMVGKMEKNLKTAMKQMTIHGVDTQTRTRVGKSK